MALTPARQSGGYSQKLSVRSIDLSSGKLIAVLNEIDARELGIFPLDRLEITNPENGRSANAVVDVTDSIIGENSIGMFRELSQLLGVRDGSAVKCNAAPKPRSVGFVKKKMDGGRLSQEELSCIIEDISSNRLSEIETTAFVSAVYMREFDLDETVAMTKALIENGRKLELSSKTVVDKHSIGGTNGRATMIIVPIIAAAGYAIPKTSSRSITSAAGTADSMEVLANVSLQLGAIKRVVEKTNGCIAWGGAVELAPADDKIIKIEHPLSLDPEGQVIASVMAKKASVGAKYVVIDIPVGPYVKVRTREKAEQMALKFVEVGKHLGMKVEVLLTNGTEPSGKAFGPALEAKYALEILEGRFFDNLARKSVEISGALLELTGDVPKGQGYAVSLDILQSGKALQKMKEIISEQGARALSSQDIKTAPYKKEVLSVQNGEISTINVGYLNHIARLAGAPANQKAGVMLDAEQGASVTKGTVLFEIYAENEAKLDAAYEFAIRNRVVEFATIIIGKFD
ncbi:MAG TPA: AMP phosphorylase [Candidatus Diapherotrites archaeon]|uniref:AMP phosphorylase n=1 Tax=Candidatus Iainarchaeum sp. TaxID=3101447 RepID=A0A7J4IW73_9ARCH|nr:AMP phosphorylase [Candidatus Diapherotrites archaeon]